MGGFSSRESLVAGKKATPASEAGWGMNSAGDQALFRRATWVETMGKSNWINLAFPLPTLSQINLSF